MVISCWSNTGTLFFFFSSRRRHTRCSRDWSSDVCSSDLLDDGAPGAQRPVEAHPGVAREDLADRFAGRYLETGSDSTALAGSLAGGGERSEHPTSVGGKRAGRTDPPGASAARGSKLSFLPASRSRSWFCPWRVVPPNSGSQ